MIRFVAISYTAIGLIEAFDWPHLLVIPPALAALLPWRRLAAAFRRPAAS